MRGAFASLLVAMALVVAPAAAADRVALVIGNGAYSGTAGLANPAGDAAAIAEKLKTLNFEVILATDVDRRGAIAAIDRFSDAMNGASLALLFFAGHGIQIGGQNFLLPTDVSVDSERALRYSAIDIQEVVAEMERRADVAIAILDACRDNPFVDAIGGLTRSSAVERGLGPMRLTGRGAIIAYAAASGDVAADGEGKHSPFAEALLQEIATPKVEVGLMFRRVARRVLETTRGDQQPEVLVRLVDEVYLNPGDGVVAATSEPVVLATATDQGKKRTTGNELFFGKRILHPPPWALDIALPKPTGWHSAPPTPVAESPNDTYGTAQALPLAALVEAHVLPLADQDWYVVNVPTAGELRLDVATPPPEIDFFARVWNANHEVVVDWQGAQRPGGAVAARFALPKAGRYWIESSDGYNDGESVASLNLAVDFAPADDPFEPNNSPAVAAALPGKAELAPTIYPRADADWYKIWVKEPGLLSVSATNVPPNLDIAVRVWNLNGAVIRDWVGPLRVGGDTVFEAQLAEPGTYLIETADASNDAAAVEPFKLTVDFRPVADALEPDNAFGTAVIVPPTGKHDLAIFPRADADWLALDVDHPGELRFSATTLPENLDLYMRVWTADKLVLRDWVGPARIGGDVDGSADLPAAGRYFVEISDGSNDQASEKLFPVSLSFTPQPDQNEPNDGASDATPLTPGGKILFNILPVRDADWYRIETASAGELAVVIDESPENLDLYFRIWNADRGIVRDWVPPYRKGGVAEGFADLPRAGVYFIEITDGANDDRSVQPATLSTTFTAAVDPFEPNDGFGQPATLKLGEPHLANILPIADTDWYLLEAPGAGVFTVTVDEVDPGLDIVVRLFDADAHVVWDWRGPPRPGGVTDTDFTVAAAGLYRLQVADGANDARSKNPYRIEVSFR